MNSHERELQKRNEELLLAAALKACRDSEDSPVKGKNNAHQHTLNYLNRVRPWPLRLKLFIYSVLLRFFLRHQLFLVKHFYACSAQFEEKIEQFKFGAQFGCSGSVDGRKWCLDLIEVCRIEPLDQAYLVYTKTINVKKCEVHYGKWDIVAGVASTVPLLMVVLLMLCTAWCQWLSASVKVIELSVYALIFLSQYQFFKIHCFDVYEIGSKYFQSNGWNFIPVFKTVN